MTNYHGIGVPYSTTLMHKKDLDFNTYSANSSINNLTFLTIGLLIFYMENICVVLIEHQKEIRFRH